MKTTALFVTLCLGSLFGQAPSDDKNTNPKGDRGAGSMTVTGCLEKGAQADEFTITGEDGKAYNLHSTSVKFAGHVGHKVTLTGKMSKEKEPASPGRERATAKEANELDVSNLAMVSTSCR